MRVSRRAFLGVSARAALALGASPALAQEPAPSSSRERIRGLLSDLRRKFPDLRQRFVFEYYPWYAREPWRHWDQWQRRPPDDIASNYVPRLGPYDSRDRATLEQHARWIAESGVGAVNLSWWGRGSFEDRATDLVLDVLRDHGLKATVHLEPYRSDRARFFADDVLYVLRTFGERRRFDVLLLPRDASGRTGPVFKGFAMIVPRQAPHCRGGLRPVAGYTPDAQWRRQVDTLRHLLRHDFDHLTLLADSLDMGRTAASGFDGIAFYDNRLAPESYAAIVADAAKLEDLLAFPHVNPGFDTITPRAFRASDCFVFQPFVPDAGRIDWSRAEERERAAALSAARIEASLLATLEAQTAAGSANARRSQLLVFVNSFNEWHEGHAFEPMKDAAELTRAERAAGYHNPARGDYRLARLRALLSES